MKSECDDDKGDDVTNDADGGSRHREEDELWHELHDEDDQENLDEDEEQGDDPDADGQVDAAAAAIHSTTAHLCARIFWRQLFNKNWVNKSKSSLA